MLKLNSNIIQVFVDFKFGYIRVDDPDDDFSDDLVEDKFVIENNGVMKPCTCPQVEQDIQDYEDSDTGKFEMFFKQSSMCFTGKSFSEAFLHQLTNNMTRDLSLNTSSQHVEYKQKFYFCFDIQNNICTQNFVNLYFSGN